MIVTMEELENGIWCPDARVKARGGPRDHVAANRVFEDKVIKADGKKIFCCIGPACMAWRWVEKGVSGFCGRAGLPIEADGSYFKYGDIAVPGGRVGPGPVGEVGPGPVKEVKAGPALETMEAPPVTKKKAK